MRKTHQRNTVRYFLLVIGVLFFLFLSGDFGLVDVQKTAIVMAVGIDREEETFIVTSQIAVPKSSDQGKSTETVQIVSRGKTVAEAFEEINAKTGWYPKLVFCRLILLGEKTTQDNAFDALDFFLLDEYLSDNCLVAACDGFAKDLLNVTALVDASGSIAIQKVLSSHAQRVGTVLPATLREFSIGYFSESKSGFLPLLKTQPQQEQVGESGSAGNSNSGQSGQENSGGGSSSSGGGDSSSGSSSGKSGKQDKPVFSAGETALFYAGKRVGTLTEEESFAFNAVKNKLRLAAYSVETDGGTCSLTVKRNSPKTECRLSEDGRATYIVKLTMSAGLLDFSRALPVEESVDIGDIPDGAFAAAEKRLAGQIRTAFEKARKSGCDLFGILEQLQKRENRRFTAVKDEALKTALLDVSVRFRGVR